MLTDFDNFTFGKRAKFPTKFVYEFPPHLTYIAALPCEIYFA